MDTKECRICHSVLPIDSFGSGYSFCKSCRRTLDKARFQSPEYKERHRELQKASRGKEVNRARERRHGAKYLSMYPEKHSARRQLRSAINGGIVLVPDVCEKCGTKPNTRQDGRRGLHGHHHNGYSNPLDVIWLCALCHNAEHRARGEKGESRG